MSRSRSTNRLGEEGQGWAVAQSTLSSERGLTLLELSDRMRGALWRIAELIRETGREDDPGVLRDFGRLSTRVDATCALADQFLPNRIAGEERVGDASIVKLTYSRVLREYHAARPPARRHRRAVSGADHLSAAARRPATGWSIS